MAGFGKRLIGIGGMTALAGLAACGPKEPPKPAPPPPVVIVVPPRPYPPLGAPTNIVPPPVDAYGARRTINTGMSTAQTTWNFRSAYNVAALNCTRPEHAAILENYRAYLKANDKKLKAVNAAIDKEFKTKAVGTTPIRARELYMTQVYNYFALPPTLPLFCDAALAVSNEMKLAKPAEFDSASAAGLMKIDEVFKDFFTGYDQYRADLAAWQARYYPTPRPLAMAPVIALPPASPVQAR